MRSAYWKRKNAGGDLIIHTCPQKNGRERHAQNFIKENEQALNNTLAKNKPARTVPTNHSWLINELGEGAGGLFVSEVTQVLHGCPSVTNDGVFKGSG